jgi:hypothetical protein
VRNNIRQFVRLKRVTSDLSQAVTVQTASYGCLPPNGFLAVPPGSLAVAIGTKFRHGQPRAESISVIPAGAAVTGFEGMGDTIYMRAALKKLVEREGTIYLTNPWPQFFWDMPSVKMVKPTTCTLRTQMENVNSLPADTWHAEPPGLRWYEYKYSNEQYGQGKTPLTTFMGQFGVTDPIDFSLPKNSAWMTRRLSELQRPIGVVHPPSVRSEWANTARNPLVEHVQLAMDQRPDLSWVSVGWNKDGHEWPDGGPLTGVYRGFERGELSISEMLALVGMASLVVCGPSFTLPMSAALGVPALCIFGGSVPPWCLVDPRMGAHVRYAAPEPFCACFSHDHACQKHIPKERLLRELLAIGGRA